MTENSATIAALATPPGRGGIAVIVLCGPDAPGIVAEVFRPTAAHGDPGPDALRLGHLTDGRRTLDEAIVARREGAFESNIHGGPAVVAGVLRRLADCGAAVAPADHVTTSPASWPPRPGCEWQGLPAAHPRWNNPAVGREMLAALPLARGMLAVTALSGQWAGGISELAARGDPTARAARRGWPTAGQLHSAADGLRKMQRLLRPAEVVLAGAPNAGKSTLSNALVGREASTVHQTAGTTRDWVREIALIKDVPVWLTDTAGIWRADDPLQAEAVRRARHRIDRADLVVLLGDISEGHGRDHRELLPALRSLSAPLGVVFSSDGIDNPWRRKNTKGTSARRS